MAVFCRKKLEAPQTVGACLKKAREDKNISLEMIASQTHISLKHLIAIESGTFCDLPQAKAHCLAYVRSYANALELKPDALIRRFAKEANLENYQPTPPARYLKIKSASVAMILKTAGAAALIVLFLGYLSWQIYGILQPPKLIVYSPTEGLVTSQLSVVIKGQTQKEIKLTINGQEIMADEQGRFEMNLDLSNGLNTIIIIATKKHGKTTTVTRHVVVNSV